MTWDELFRLFTGLVAVGGLFISILVSMRSARRDVVDDLTKEVERLEKKITKLERDKEQLEDWANRLVRQIVEAGMIPVPFRQKADD